MKAVVVVVLLSPRFFSPSSGRTTSRRGEGKKLQFLCQSDILSRHGDGQGECVHLVGSPLSQCCVRQTTASWLNKVGAAWSTLACGALGGSPAPIGYPSITRLTRSPLGAVLCRQAPPAGGTFRRRTEGGPFWDSEWGPVVSENV